MSPLVSHRTLATRVVLVPFNAAGVPSGVAGMPRAIHSAGLMERLPGTASATWITTDQMIPVRGPSALLAEDALTAMVRDTAAALAAAWHDSEVPLVVAGDCPVLLAPLIAAGDRGGAGLVFVDGHEDAWDPLVTPTGEASDCELGLALGWYRGPDSLPGLPCLRTEHLTVLGPRDQQEIAAAGQPSISSRVPHYLDGPQLARRLESHADAVADLVARSAGTAEAGWWYHVDLDVLATSALPAVDYPQPGGLSWTQLERVTTACLSVPGCLGASVVIYNPDLDGGRSAARIVDFLAFVRDRLGPGSTR